MWVTTEDDAVDVVTAKDDAVDVVTFKNDLVAVITAGTRLSTSTFGVYPGVYSAACRTV